MRPALANGYADPTKLHEVYTIPRPNDRRARRASRRRSRTAMSASGSTRCAPQTDEYKALSEAFVQLSPSSPRRTDPAADPGGQADQARRERSAQCRPIVAVLPFGRLSRPLDGGRRRPPAAGPDSYTPGTGRGGEAVSEPNSGSSPTASSASDTIDALNAGPGVSRAPDSPSRWSGCAGFSATRRRRGSTSTPPRRSSITGATGSTSTIARSIDGEARQADPAAPGADLPARRQADLDRARRRSPRRSSRTRARPGCRTTISCMKDGHYVQESGPKNSLGLVKFDMAGRPGDLPPRHAGEGGVRAARPPSQPRLRPGRERTPVRDRARAAGRRARPVPEGDAASDDETFIKLPKEIPVRLLYQTAFWDGSRVQFRPDVYGWDDNIAKALELAPGPPRKIQQPESSDDIGP